MATLENTLSGVLFEGTNDADSLHNGYTNDSSVASNVTVLGYAGDDYISNAASSVTIDSGLGNDTVDTWNGTNIVIQTSDGDDSVHTTSTYSTINGGSGNNTIDNVGYFNLVVTGNGNNSIRNEYQSVTITSGSGDDTIWSSGSSTTNYVIIDAGDGNNYIEFSDVSGTDVSGVAQQTMILRYDSIRSGNGSDTIIVTNYDNTINAGGGNDFISIVGGTLHSILYTEGEGNDTVWGYDDTDRISISSSSGYSTQTSGNDLIIGVSDGSIRLVDAASITPVIIGADIIDTVTTSGWATVRSSSGSTVVSTSVAQGTDSADTILSDGLNLVNAYAVYGNGGDDSIDITSSDVSAVQYSDFSVDGGAGNDTINFTAEDNGEDNRWASIYHATVNAAGGTGNDLIKVAAQNGSAIYDGSVVEVSGGAGNDTLSITGGEGHGVIYASTLNVDMGADADLIRLRGYDVIHGGSLVTLNGGEGNDTIRINANGTGIYQSSATINGGAGNDLILVSGSVYGGIYQSNVSIGGGEGADTIYVSSINESNASIVAGAGDMISVTSGGATYIFDSTSTTTINGAQFTASAANTSASLETSSNGTSIRSSWNGAVAITEGNALTDINGSVVSSAGSYDIVNGAFSVTDTTPPDTIPAVTSGWATITSASGTRIIAGSVTSAQGTDESETIQSTNIGTPPRAIYGGGGNDIISVYDDRAISDSASATIDGGAGNDLISIASSSSNDGIYNSTVSIGGGEGNDTISIRSNGYRAISESIVTIDGGTGDDVINISDSSESYDRGIWSSTISVDGGAGADTIRINHAGANGNGIYDSTVTINGGADNDLISITGGYAGIANSTVSINGGDGADTISVNNISNSNVSIVAGAGDVVSVGSGGATYIFDSTSTTTINGAQFTASAANTSASLETSSNGTSIRSSWNGTVSIASGNSLTDINGSVVSSAGSYDIVNGAFVGGGNDTVPVSISSVYVNLSGASSTTGVFVINGTSSVSSFKSAAGDNETVVGNVSSQNYSAVNLLGQDIAVPANWTVMATAQNDRISIGGNNVSVNAGEGNNYIYNGDARNYVTMTAGSGNDTILNHGQYVVIDGGDGNDSIRTDVYGERETWRDVTVYGGAGNDVLVVNDNACLLDGGDGDDTISVAGGRNNNSNQSGGWTANTLRGGTGNDTIYGGSANVFIYDEGDGDDIIYNFANGDNLKINTTYSTLRSGNDIIISTAGNGHITLSSVSDLTVVINDDTINGGNSTVSATAMNIGSRWSYRFTTRLVSSADLIDDNEFSYYYGSGNDTIETDGNEAVNFYDMTVDQILSTEISSGAVKINFDDGNALTVLGQNNRYVVDGTTWLANQDTQTWSRQK